MQPSHRNIADVPGFATNNLTGKSERIARNVLSATTTLEVGIDMQEDCLIVAVYLKYLLDRYLLSAPW